MSILTTNIKNIILTQLDDLKDATIKMLLHELSISNMHTPRYYAALSRYEKSGLIRKKRKGREVALAITNEGRQFLKKPYKHTLRNDGLSTIIIFDIPENKRRARENFRRYLLRHGYTLLQESVLIAPYQIPEELKQVLVELAIEQNVTIISGKISYI